MTRILVAEDSSTQAVQLRGLLEQAGFDVTVVENGVQALESVRSQPPDALITDLYMPEMDGLQLVEAVRGEFPKLPVILNTAKGSEEIAVKALKAGATSYVPKRLLQQEIISTLNNVLAVVHQKYNDSQVWRYWTGGQSRYRFGSDPALIPTIVAQLEKQIKAAGFCDETGLLRIGMALCEALDNAIFHGNLEVDSKLREDDDSQYYDLAQQRRHQAPFRDRHVEVFSKIDREQAVFTIEDEGQGFNPDNLPDPTDPTNLEKVSGRGLTLIRNMMDEVRHNQRGNQITMVKRCDVMVKRCDVA